MASRMLTPLTMELLTTREIENFGRNILFVPHVYYEPTNEAQLVEILRRHAGQKIKVIGSRHSWSPVAECPQVVVSLRLFTEVRLCATPEGGTAAWAGGGIQIKHLLKKLSKFGKTLPSLGLITEQTIVGAISTGTHGSGRHCLSHYVQAVRLIRYAENGLDPIVEEINSGDALRAVQCGLGSLGVIVSVKIACRDCYQIAEVWRTYDRLDEVLEMESDYPLQQFFLIPWKWSFLAQHRQPCDQSTSTLEWLYRIYFFLAIDIGLHLVIQIFGKLVDRKRWVQTVFRKWLWRSIVTNWTVIGESSRMLVMEHELFRHIETELFVTRDRLPAALEFVQRSLSWAAGDGADLPDEYLRQVTDSGLTAEFQVARGVYCHHYPICVRRIVPDTTLISMTSGGSSDWYSISLISYHSKSRRDGFFKAISFIAKAAATLFEARPHWGKHNPLQARELVRLYPNFAKFKQVCSQLDSHRAFRNQWFEELFQAHDHSTDHSTMLK